ncbi:MAG: hypothetical protein M3295_05400, partial [Chloroflexota bacterium]|nr:hypothetical protein [Chloroflexota bacterium]
DRDRGDRERAERGDRPERGARDRGGDRDRSDRDRGRRRDRREARDDYRPEDATAEPTGGIDNTMAAVFAESGLLDQFRPSREAEERAERRGTRGSERAAADDEQPEATAEPEEPIV